MLSSADNLSKLEPTIPPDGNDRLIIHKIVVENFKSYAGRQEIGPFHKVIFTSRYLPNCQSFSSIVGPNGSGKSNVIDAIMFVLGYRAKTMRQAKLSDLIHMSEGLTELESCSVEVHFRRIMDKDGDNYDIVNDGELMVGRAAYRNNRNVYTVNGAASNYGEVTNLLRSHGIDLDHKRFLILQGEVEAIALMKPKATNEHEEGLLEYLEDIIGTNKYIGLIEEVMKDLDQTNEKHSGKLLRVRASEKECDALLREKEEAETFLRQENSLTEKQSQILQVEIWQAKKDSASLETRLVENRDKLAQEREKNGIDNAMVEDLEQNLKDSMKQATELGRKIKTLQDSLSRHEQDDIKFQEMRKHLKNKLRSLERHASDTEKQETALIRDIEDIKSTSGRLESELLIKRKELEAANEVLDKLTSSLKGISSKFQDSLSKKQSELAPLQDQLRDILQEKAMATSGLQILQDKLSSDQAGITKIEERIKAVQDEISATKAKEAKLRMEQANVEAEVPELRKSIGNHKEERDRREKDLQMLQATLAEAMASLGDDPPGSVVYKALMKESKMNRISGIHGRLGDLGAIDKKYDIAIATACSYLDHIVVDTTEAGQACIEFLRKSNIGRANFIVLEKMKRVMEKSRGLPAGAKRLFDLVKLKDARFTDAMYFALTDTLVTDDLKEAQEWAFGGSQRWRVVTLDGKLFETSGTISGGGVARKGGMRAQLQGDIVTEEQVKSLRDKVMELQETLRQLYMTTKKEETLVIQCEEKLMKIRSELLLLDNTLKLLSVELEMMQSNIGEKRKGSKVSKADEAQMRRLEREIDVIEGRAVEQKTMMKPFEDAIIAIQQQILDAGGIKYKTQKSKVDDLIEQINDSEKRLGNLDKEKINLEKRLTSLKMGAKDLVAIDQITVELSTIDSQLQELTMKAVDLQKELLLQQSSLNMRNDEIESIRERQEHLNKSVSKFRRLEYELRTAIETDEDKFEVAKKIIGSGTRELTCLKLHSIDGQSPILATYEEEADLIELSRSLSTLKQSIQSLKTKISQARPNLKVLEEFRTKKTMLTLQQTELEEIESHRNNIRNQYEDLCRKRLEEFMMGFRTISAHLKEMYELITMGGNAELEMVDSLDPFSEGILFSVMPPRKSWKPISNLSGGEKTLSSLALVFALHVYRPTPIYVMDEIDAALDFRNVSIIAHYIRERTRGAQFIVVSLRNSMFELADRLVGIYKIYQRTKSVAIDSKRFLLGNS